MFQKRIIKVFCILFGFALQSCSMPTGTMARSDWNGGLPTSTTEMHTRTTVVTPPSQVTSYEAEAKPALHQPVMHKAPVHQVYSEVARPSNHPFSHVDNLSSHTYRVSAPQQAPEKYTIEIPAAPAPQYTINLPQANPPQFSIVQPRAVAAQAPVRVEYEDNRK